MGFEWPLVLFGLPVVPLLICALVLSERRRRGYEGRFSTPLLWRFVVDRAPGRLRYMPRALMLVSLILLIVGTARPRAMVSVRREQATVVLVLDVSRSMLASDVRPSRLAVARAAAKSFLRRLPGSFGVAIVGLGSRAVVAVPPTRDRRLASAGLDELGAGKATALGDSLVLAASLERRQRTRAGVVPEAVLLISDGAPDGGRTSVAAAIAKARTLAVPVSTLLVGTGNGVVSFSLPGGLRQFVQVPASPGTLRRIAAGTGGRFFTSPNDPGLAKVYQRLGERRGWVRQRREVSDLFAAGAVALMLAGAVLSLRWFRRPI